VRRGVRVNRLSLRRGADGGGAERVPAASKPSVTEFHRVHTAFHREKANGAPRKVASASAPVASAMTIGMAGHADMD
jgi:hypothetical protein